MKQTLIVCFTYLKIVFFLTTFNLTHILGTKLCVQTQNCAHRVLATVTIRFSSHELFTTSLSKIK